MVNTSHGKEYIATDEELEEMIEARQNGEENEERFNRPFRPRRTFRRRGAAPGGSCGQFRQPPSRAHLLDAACERGGRPDVRAGAEDAVCGLTQRQLEVLLGGKSGPAR